MHLSAAGRKVARNLEILRSIGEQIQNDKQLLFDLCLTSKVFNFEFTRHVYWKIGPTIDLYRLGPSNPSLIHTRAFILTSLPKSNEWPKSPDVNEKVRQLVGRMENLKIFRWSLRYSPPEAATIALLRNSCPQIKSLQLELLDFMKYDLDLQKAVDRGPHTFDISPLENLTSLTLNSMYGDLAQWQRQIVQVLVKSPALEKLSLSISRLTLGRYDAWGLPDHAKFFDRLCVHYAERGGQPLHLKTLTMGQSIFPMSYQALTNFVDLSYLEEVYIDNNGSLYDSSEVFELYRDDEWNAESAIVFHAFSPANCINLRRFGVSEFRMDVDKFLRGYAKYPSASRRLAFACREEIWDLHTTKLLQAVEQHSGLPIQLRMMKVDLRQFNQEDFEICLGNLVAANGDSLEGLVLVVGHLDERHHWLRTHMQDLEAAFSSFTKLTQLDFAYAYHRGEYKPFLLFEKLALACPSLQYIRSEGRCWRIRRRDGTMDVEFERLSREEMDSVELFSFFLPAGGVRWEILKG
ncbi:hypothetical protein B0T21DRAFT_375385 [Apiosordaria backusii]|uniref:Uncharacterized protein n=1 Tax=Apiosordaria backusii TaxID=314023 RepID=A0AA40AJ13_9PEZI|nr:hypothetical protein B0T21DRAFT_375385 [Apiosordaria backusii]